MTSPADTALAFAREVMGWEDAEQERFLDGVWPFILITGHSYFAFTNLTAVLEAVRIWCDTNDGAVELSYYGYVPGEWEARVSSSTSLETIVHSDPCYALLAACVEAARKLNAN